MNTMTPREFVDGIDTLINLALDRLALRVEDKPTAPVDEQIELLKRDLTDYLLRSSAEKGVYAGGGPPSRDKEERIYCPRYGNPQVNCRCGWCRDHPEYFA